MIKSQGSPFGFKSGRIPRLPPWDQKCSNSKGPPLGSKVVEFQGHPLGSEMFKSQGSPLGPKMVKSQGFSFVFENDQISRVPLWVQKWSNTKVPPLGSAMFKSQGSPLGLKSGRIPRVLFWDQK